MEIDILNIDKNIRDKWKNNKDKITIIMGAALRVVLSPFTSS